ncbi:hypothetical protein [Sneathiella glossodoripedis]|uniref:hypothetical protein n=1 Tax=Sneathiella glossodoripedis TaxID=418853 RepID=UPI00046FCBF6|nr:hypothetical protein [Sneathiella glossodoripedis]
MKPPQTHKNISSSKTDVDMFLQKVAATPKKVTTGDTGRLLFAIDATASRQPTWDNAAHIQCEMFEEASRIGALSMQVAFFRGYREFKATGWTTNSSALTRSMSKVTCLGGHTQIERVLSHAIKTNSDKPVNAVIFIGDCVEEDADALCHLAGRLGLVNVPVFIFQEGYDAGAENCFRQICKLSGGAYLRFDENSVSKLRELLKAIAIFAVGGRKALEDHGRKQGGDIPLLLSQLRK